MTTEETKKWLSRAYWIDKELSALEQARREAWEQVTSATSNYEQHTKQTRNVHRFDKIAELDDLIGQMTDALLCAKTEIIKEIGALPEEKGRVLLEKRYLSGESFDSIAQFMNYEIRQVFRIHGAAIKELALRLSQEDNNG